MTIKGMARALTLCVSTLAFSASVGNSTTQIQALDVQPLESSYTEGGVAETQRAFARQQLISTIRLYNEHMRHDETGQYLDRVDLREDEQTSTRSSIASTGVGLISLAIGHQLGEVDDAAEKARFTLSALLGYEKQTGFNTPRSQNGWFKHFIDAKTGEGLGGSKHVFSTIDTAILGVGASMVGSYFSKIDDPKAQEAARLAKELVTGINWSQAVRFDGRPGIHQVFRGPQEGVEDRFWSILFDEYIILPCLGRAHEAAQGTAGPATRFWNAFVPSASDLPQTEIEGHSVLAVAGKRVASHFTHQFGYYFCGDLAADQTYVNELYELKQVDKKWFHAHGKGDFPKRWWGLGAGSEIKFDRETGDIKYSAYGVARIGKNHNDTFSPAIMAGFLPSEEATVYDQENTKPEDYSPIIANLIDLHTRGECRYTYQELDFLWRCTARDPKLRVNHVEGVDMSTYLLGLAWYDEKIGKDFFREHSVKTRVNWPEARELRASVSGPSRNR